MEQSQDRALWRVFALSVSYVVLLSWFAGEYSQLLA